MFPAEGKDKKSTVIYYDNISLKSYRENFSTGEQAKLEHINRKIAETDSLEDILEFLLLSCSEQTSTDRLCLVFVEEEGMRAYSKAIVTRYEPVLLKKGYSQDIRQGSLPVVIEKGYPRVITDLADYSASHPESESTALLVKEGVRSSMTCPLIVHGKTIGLLFRNSKLPDAYGLHEVMLHLATAERISQTVEKAYRIQQLEEANRNYTEMLGFISHELKSPLASIVLDSNLILEEYLGKITDKQRDKLNIMVEKAEYLLDMIEEYLNLNRIENTELEMVIRENTDLPTTVIIPALNIVIAQAEEKNIRIETLYPEDLVSVDCDPALMKIVMVNLLSNGIKYGIQDGLLKITVKETETELSVEVFNTGPGFPDSEKIRLFRKFSRLQTPELMSRKGTGVGLYTVWRIIRLHNGRIVAASVEGNWAKFTFSVPLKQT